jgi:transposase-like protein
VISTQKVLGLVPEFREQAARLVIETGCPVAHVAAEIGVGEQALGRWVAWRKERPRVAILARCLMLMSAQSWSVFAERTPNYVWTVSF